MEDFATTSFGSSFWSLLPSNQKALLVGVACILFVIIVRNIFLCTARKSRKRKKALYCHIVEQANTPENETPVFRSRLAATELISRFPDRPAADTLYDNFQETLKRHPDLPFLGTRTDNEGYLWETYKTVSQRATAIGSALLEFGLRPGDFVGICARNRPEWIILREACNAFSFVCVHLYTTFRDDSIAHIIQEASLKVIFADKSKTKWVSACSKDAKQLEIIVSLDPIDDLLGHCHTEYPEIKFFEFSQFEKIGQKKPAKHIPPSPNDLATICYTSGTTREPKGVLLTHENLIADAAGCSSSGIVVLSQHDIHLSYLPLAHMFEQLIILLITYAGARVGFFRGDVRRHLFADIQTLQPTIFPSVPKLFSRIHDKVMQGINEYPSWKRNLFQTAYAAKKRRLDTDGVFTHYLWDMLVFRKIQNLLGGNVRLMITGSAPTSPNVLDFMRICFSCEVHEGYGLTECSTACAASIPGTFSTSNVGAPLPCAEMKLVDVAELNYFTSDLPHPRGEIYVRGPIICQGYLNLPEETAKIIDKDGWLKTGDIGEWLSDGTLRIVDRKSSIFKMSQGEFVAPEKVENAIIDSKYVQMAFAYGDRFKSSVVCVVVPDPAAVNTWANDNHRSGIDLETLCCSEDLRKQILADINSVGRENGLTGYEIPRAIYLEPKPFDVARGIVTPTLKLKRSSAKHVYQKQIEEMYQSIGE